jgi:Ca-activated chloride channel homolog
MHRHSIFLSGLVLGAAATLAACSQPPSRPEPVDTDATSAPESQQKAEAGASRIEPEGLAEPATRGDLAGAAAATGERKAKEQMAIEQRRQALGARVAAPMAKASAADAYARIAPPPSMPMPMPTLIAPAPENREHYAAFDANPIHRVAETPVSTFSIDVDTGSYANVRRYLMQGQLPPQDAVRVEELINTFDYAYAAPAQRGQPFSMLTEIAPTPWNAKTHLLHVGIQGWKPETRPVGSNLVFLVDVSGSMQDADKLPLVKGALKMLVNELTPKDRISLVVYAGASGVVLEPTSGAEKARIVAALDRLEAGGSTNGAAGIQLAYAMAKQGWIEGGVNRVLLATDGDFNVGITRFESLLDLVKAERRTGIALTTLGFGEGNYNDHLMEQLADVGDGNHAYIDSLQEAHKVLVRQREATLTTIARDVKIQIEFNPAAVAEYRLIGYENRMLAREDFQNDAVDAGDIGAGHTVTALYEIALVGSGGERVQPLRYGNLAPTARVESDSELAHLRLRWKKPDEGADAKSRLIERPLLRSEIKAELAQASEALRLSAAVAAFGQLLSGGVHLEGFDYTAVERLAGSTGDDVHGDRAGFRQLVKLAGSLSKQARGQGGDVAIGG